MVTGKAGNIPIHAFSPVAPVSPVMPSARAVDLRSAFRTRLHQAKPASGVLSATRTTGGRQPDRSPEVVSVLSGVPRQQNAEEQEKGCAAALSIGRLEGSRGGDGPMDARTYFGTAGHPGWSDDRA